MNNLQFDFIKDDENFLCSYFSDTQDSTIIYAIDTSEENAFQIIIKSPYLREVAKSRSINNWKLINSVRASLLNGSYMDALSGFGGHLIDFVGLGKYFRVNGFVNYMFDDFERYCNSLDSWNEKDELSI